MDPLTLPIVGAILFPTLVPVAVVSTYDGKKGHRKGSKNGHRDADDSDSKLILEGATLPDDTPRRRHHRNRAASDQPVIFYAEQYSVEYAELYRKKHHHVDEESKPASSRGIRGIESAANDFPNTYFLPKDPNQSAFEPVDEVTGARGRGVRFA